jgi:hypothetical protein
MVEVAIEQMKQIEAPGEPEDWRIGFHMPPFTSIDHIHLHAVAGDLNMGGKIKFHKFLPVEVLLETLQDGEPGPAEIGFKAAMARHAEVRRSETTESSPPKQV